MAHARNLRGDLWQLYWLFGKFPAAGTLVFPIYQYPYICIFGSLGGCAKPCGDWLAIRSSGWWSCHILGIRWHDCLGVTCDLVLANTGIHRLFPGLYADVLLYRCG